MSGMRGGRGGSEHDSYAYCQSKDSRKVILRWLSENSLESAAPLAARLEEQGRNAKTTSQSLRARELLSGKPEGAGFCIRQV